MRLCGPVAPAPALVPCWAFPTAPSQPLATPGATEHPTIRPTQPVNPIDATTATRRRGGGDAVLRPHRSRRIRGRRRRPAPAGAPGPPRRWPTPACTPMSWSSPSSTPPPPTDTAPHLHPSPSARCTPTRQPMVQVVVRNCDGCRSPTAARTTAAGSCVPNPWPRPCSSPSPRPRMQTPPNSRSARPRADASPRPPSSSPVESRLLMQRGPAESSIDQYLPRRHGPLAHRLGPAHLPHAHHVIRTALADHSSLACPPENL